MLVRRLHPTEITLLRDLKLGQIPIFDSVPDGAFELLAGNHRGFTHYAYWYVTKTYKKIHLIQILIVVGEIMCAK